MRVFKKPNQADKTAVFYYVMGILDGIVFGEVGQNFYNIEVLNNGTIIEKNYANMTWKDIYDEIHKFYKDNPNLRYLTIPIVVYKSPKRILETN